MKTRYTLTFALEALIFVLSFFTDWYDLLSIGLVVLLVLSMLNNLGNGIVLREIIALHMCFVCLVMPVVGYAFFDQSNRLARTFIKYMLVPESEYFGFALPAVSGFILFLCWPIGGKNYSDIGPFLRQMIDKAKTVLERRKNTGAALVIVGTLMFPVSAILPSVVRFAFELLYFASFAGVLYVYFQKQLRYRGLLLIFFTVFTLAIAISSAVFTVVAYMSVTMFSFFFLGRKAKFWKKVLIFFIGVFILLIIQTVKPVYRIATWGKNYHGDKAALFASLFMERLGDPASTLRSADAFFPIYIRANQGFNVTLVMRRFPSRKPFDGGVNLLTSLASSLVPRFLWPDKPEAGGKYNMAYYAGIYIKGWSTNVGPLGEAYGSFGVNGGIIFMIFLGAFIRLAYLIMIRRSTKTPLLIFWMPVLFFQVTYAAETDTLQILNSLFKSAFFIWLMCRTLPFLFGIEKKTRSQISPILPNPPAVRLDH